jgi:hypothetical protein
LDTAVDRLPGFSQEIHPEHLSVRLLRFRR